MNERNEWALGTCLPVLCLQVAATQRSRIAIHLASLRARVCWPCSTLHLFYPLLVSKTHSILEPFYSLTPADAPALQRGLSNCFDYGPPMMLRMHPIIRLNTPSQECVIMSYWAL